MMTNVAGGPAIALDVLVRNKALEALSQRRELEAKQVAELKKNLLDYLSREFEAIFGTLLPQEEGQWIELKPSYNYGELGYGWQVKNEQGRPILELARQQDDQQSQFLFRLVYNCSVCGNTFPSPFYEGLVEAGEDVERWQNGTDYLCEHCFKIRYPF